IRNQEPGIRNQQLELEQEETEGTEWLKQIAFSVSSVASCSMIPDSASSQRQRRGVNDGAAGGKEGVVAAAWFAAGRAARGWATTTPPRVATPRCQQHRR